MTPGSTRPAGAISLVIVEDHAAVAESLSIAFAGIDDMHVLDVAPDLGTGLSVIGARQPDVALLDATLPDGDGAAAAPEIAERSPGTAVVVMSGSQYPSTPVRAVLSGAAGFVSKVAPLEDIVSAVRAAASGGTFFAPEHLRAAVAAQSSGDSVLTERELEILQLLAHGHATEEIVEDLQLSVHTVRNHINSMLGKLGVGSRVEAVAAAHRQGLVTPPS